MAGNKGGSDNKYFSMQIDKKLANDFEYFCDCSGITKSDAVTMLAKRVIKDHEIPFAIEPVEIYTKAVGVGSKDKQKSTRVTVRMDPDIRKEFSDVCNDIGITMSVLVRIFFMQTLNDNKLPL